MTKNNPQAELFLICRSAAYRCALPLDKVTEVMRALPLERVPDAPSRNATNLPSFILGAAVIRGAIVPVISLARMLGGDAAPARYISLKLDARCVALAVDEVTGIRGLDGSMEEMAPLLRTVDHTALSTITTLDNELLLVLQTARLIPDTVWASLVEQGQSS